MEKVGGVDDAGKLGASRRDNPHGGSYVCVPPVSEVATCHAASEAQHRMAVAHRAWGLTAILRGRRDAPRAPRIRALTRLAEDRWSVDPTKEGPWNRDSTKTWRRKQADSAQGTRSLSTSDAAYDAMR